MAAKRFFGYTGRGVLQPRRSERLSGGFARQFWDIEAQRASEEVVFFALGHTILADQWVHGARVGLRWRFSAQNFPDSF